MAAEPNDITIETGSAAYALVQIGRRIERHLDGLSPQEVAINAGLSLAALLAAIGLSALLGRLAKQRRPSGDGDGEDRGRAIAPWTVLAFRVLLAAALIYGVIRIWGIDPIGWIVGDEAAAVAAGVAQVLITAILIAGVWEGASALIVRGMSRRAAREREPRKVAQLQSLAPLLVGAVQTVVAVFGVLLLVSQLGLDLAPLIAGAGVISIAIGFGAQTLVKDYLTGFSMVLEDIAAVGDVVRIGDSSGLVESMTLRTIRLRDFDGTLHVIPYSEAQIVHNMTKDFSYYVFDLAISYGSDIDQALTLMKRVGDDLREHPYFAPMVLAPIEVFGVDKLAESGIILKARIKTAPIKQWEVGREYNRRIKQAFDGAGIEIPLPHLKLVTDAFPAPESLIEAGSNRREDGDAAKTEHRQG